MEWEPSEPTGRSGVLRRRRHRRRAPLHLLWWYGAYVAKLTIPALTERQRRAHTLAWAPAPFVVAALTAVAFLNPSLAVAGFVAAVIAYVLPVPTLVALVHRRRARSHHRS